MKSVYAKFLFLTLSIFVAMPLVTPAQTTKPRLRRTTPARRVVTLVPAGTDLKIRLNDTLSSKDSRAGDKFTATVVNPSRFDEARVYGHIKSIVKSGRIQGRTTMNLAFDSITLSDNRSGALHGYVTHVYGDKGRTDEEGGVQSESRGRQTIKRSLEEPKLEVGDTVSITEGVIGIVLARYIPSGGRNDVYYVVEVVSDPRDKREPATQ